jgi:tetratricopeptide (TPR) repeat protein
MKAEERHKLETNVLADWIGQTIKDFKPYSRAVTTALVLLVLVIAALILWPRYRDRGLASAWDAYYSALAADNYAELEAIAADHPRTSVAHWSLVVAADARLATACMQLFTDKVSAAQELRRAIEDYTAVIDQSREPRLRERSLFGRARAYEAVSGSRQGEGELPKAIADYERVVAEWPNGTYAPMAGEQLKRLKTQDFKVFYDKFAAYSPKRPVSKEPGAGVKLPFDSSSLPDDASPSGFSQLLNLDDLKVTGGKTTGKKEEPAKPEPGKAEPPKTEAPKTEPAKTGTPKTEPPKSEPPKTAPPAPPKAEAPKTDSPKK